MSVQVTAQQLRAAARTMVNEQNMNSVLTALDHYGGRFGLDRVHRSVQYLAQLMHESGDFRYDREIWGPTEAQKRYDTRTDLGNTPALDGDGKKYMGRTGGQLTGKANYLDFYDWCVEQRLDPPDFVAKPELVNTDPWEGLVPIWFWQSRNLNRYADQGDIETITKRWNGGMNGFADRLDHLVRLSLVVLGYAPDGVRQFQAKAGLAVDGDPGPKTRAALHKALLALSGASTKMAAFQAAPVVEEVPVVPEAVDRSVKKKFNLLGWLWSGIGGGGFGLAALAGFDWRALLVLVGAALVIGLLGLVLRNWLISAIKDIRQAVEN